MRVNSIAHDGALNCTTPPQPMAHARFAISLNGRDFTPARGANAHVGGVNARDREFSSAIRAHDSASLRYRAYRQAVHSVWPLGAPASGRTVITLSGEGFSSFGSVGGAVVGGAGVGDAVVGGGGEGGAAGLAACRFLPVDAPSRACEEYDEARLRHSTLARCRSRAAVVFRAAAAALAASAGSVETPVGSAMESAVGSKYRGGMGGGMGADLSGGGYDETGADLSGGNESGAVLGAALERLGSGYTDTIRKVSHRMRALSVCSSPSMEKTISTRSRRCASDGF